MSYAVKGAHTGRGAWMHSVNEIYGERATPTDRLLKYTDTFWETPIVA